MKLSLILVGIGAISSTEEFDEINHRRVARGIRAIEYSGYLSTVLRTYFRFQSEFEERTAQELFGDSICHQFNTRGCNTLSARSYFDEAGVILRKMPRKVTAQRTLDEFTAFPDGMCLIYSTWFYGCYPCPPNCRVEGMEAYRTPDDENELYTWLYIYFNAYRVELGLNPAKYDRSLPRPGSWEGCLFDNKDRTCQQFKDGDYVVIKKTLSRSSRDAINRELYAFTRLHPQFNSNDYWDLRVGFAIDFDHFEAWFTYKPPLD
ncbi:hypothetical protein L0F63_005971 [Massospora cicadina]|nr:hypothetical protein L0F63_005971 [Massospora cicadina]